MNRRNRPRAFTYRDKHEGARLVKPDNTLTGWATGLDLQCATRLIDKRDVVCVRTGKEKRS
jgi:hypothetical protein